MKLNFSHLSDISGILGFIWYVGFFSTPSFCCPHMENHKFQEINWSCHLQMDPIRPCALTLPSDMWNGSCFNVWIFGLKVTCTFFFCPFFFLKVFIPMKSKMQPAGYFLRFCCLKPSGMLLGFFIAVPLLSL